MNNSKGNFNTRLGGILAAAGSAVGLGNIWRFPSEAGAHGGAAFMLIYVLFMIILGVPVMTSELTVGRYGGKSVSHSFLTMSGGKKAWGLMGLFPAVAGVLVLSYYSVVAGWTLDYLYETAAGNFANKTPEEYSAAFTVFSSDIFRPIICLLLMLLFTCMIVASGVQKGIERGSKIMMPVLFLCLTVLVVCSFTLPGVSTGLSFFLDPDFSKVTGGTVLSAMGQAFFSLSVGIFCLCTYGCYFRKDVNLIKESFSVAGIDTLVALMAGLIIFPAVYSMPGVYPDAGPGLVFITLPNVFQHVFSGSPVFAYVFSLLFHLLLVMAAVTSMISMLEMVVAVFVRRYKMERSAACITTTVVCFLLGSVCSLSFGAWSGVRIFGMSAFDFFDFLVAKFLMPVGAFVLCMFVGWVIDKNTLKKEITNGGSIRQPFYPVYRFIVRYIAPLCIMLIFMNELGIF